MSNFVSVDLPQLPLLLSDLSEDCIFTKPSGVLITGISGTGKTFLAQQISQHLAPRYAYFTVSCADFVSAEVGRTEKILKEVFHKAMLAAPSLLLLDGLDLVVRNEEADDGDMQEASRLQRSVEGTLCVLMDEAQRQAKGLCGRGTVGRCVAAGVLVVATAASPSALPASLLRAQRLEEYVHLLVPSLRARRAFLQQLRCDDEQLLLDSDGWTFAELRQHVLARQVWAL